MENILEVKGLNKSYQHFSLQDVPFHCQKDVLRVLSE